MDEAQLKEFSEERVGTLLCDKWRLERLLGVGGTASVYSASHRNGKRVAVKVLHPELSAQKQFRDRFLREGYVGNRIEHEGAVTVYDDDETEDGCSLLVMDLLEGENLEARRDRKGGKLDALEVLSLIDDVLDTLRAAHEKGVVHRDIKPENLFVTTDNKVKLLDFGIARIDVDENPGKTLAGIAMGTPAFMPPEQASARWDQVDSKSDLWAIGASMFTLLTGRYVHEGQTVNESLAMAVTKHAPPIETVEPNVPPNIAMIVNKALQRDKSKRWQSAESMQEAVRLAYRDLQDVPEDERYSLTAGKVASHSAPPGAMNHHSLSWMNGATTGEPVSAEVVASLSDPKKRRLAIGLVAAVALLALIVTVGSGSDDSDDSAAAAQAAQTAQPEVPTVSAIAALPVAPKDVVEPAQGVDADDLEPVDDKEADEADSAEDEAAEDSEADADGDEEAEKETAPKKPRRWKPRPKPAEPFDPFKKRD